MITLKLILITYIVVMGFKIVFSDGMLLERVGHYFERKEEDGHKWAMMFICPWCMPTLGSLLAHAVAMSLGVIPVEFHWTMLVREVLVVMGTSLISGLTWTIYETINQVKDRNEWEANYYRTFVEDDDHVTNN